MNAAEAPADLDEPWWVASARRRHTRLLLLAMAEAVLLVGLSFTFLLIFHQHSSKHRLQSWQLLIPLYPGLLVIGEMVLILWLRRRGVGWAQPSPLLAVKLRRRRRITRGIRRGQILPGEDGDIAIATARHAVRNRWPVIALRVSTGCFLLTATLLPHLRWMWAVLAALVGGLSLWIQIFRTRASRFLALNPAAGGASTADPSS